MRHKSFNSTVVRLYLIVSMFFILSNKMFQFYSSPIISQQIAILFALFIVFQFYSSPIISSFPSSVYPKISSFQFYSSPIISRICDRVYIKRREFQFYSSPIISNRGIVENNFHVLVSILQQSDYISGITRRSQRIY